MAGNIFSQWLYHRPAAFLGFQKAYNWPLFFVFAGAMFGFALARLEYLSAARYAKGAAPGEWYWEREGHRRVGLYIHLGAILPAGLLLVWQFIPAIRHRALIFHRINGWLVITLITISHAGALMIARRAFGGDIGFQGIVGLSVIMVTSAIVMAVYNIKRLQIDQHRAWMLRAMFYIGWIITFRLIMIIGAQVVTAIGSYYTVMQCGEVAFINNDNSNSTYMDLQYPSCVGASASQAIPVHASFTGPRAENIGAALRVNTGFGAALAFILHVVGVEIYLRLTPRESERLRQVSATRQMEAGYSNPGSAGLVVERFGDADAWSPKESQQMNDSFNDEERR